MKAKVISLDALHTALSAALTSLDGGAFEADVPVPAAAVVAGVAALNIDDALVNSRAYRHPISGEPQWTEALGQAQSDQRVHLYLGAPQYAKVDIRLQEVLLRLNATDMGIQRPGTIFLAQYTGNYDGMDPQAWVEAERNRLGLGPSGGGAA